MSDHDAREERLDLAKALRRRMTPEERTLWHRLRTNKLNQIHFRRQHVIDGFIVDFYCPAARLVIEVDGPAHQARNELDNARDEALAARGLAVLRVQNADIQCSIEGVLEQIATIANRRIEDRSGRDRT